MSDPAFSVKCRSYLLFGDNNAEIEREKFQYLKTAKLKIPRGGKGELVVSCQVINPFCSLWVIFCGFISHLIGHEKINIPEIFSGVHGFTGKTVIKTTHNNEQYSTLLDKSVFWKI